MSSFRFVGIETYMYGTVPSAGTVNGCCIVNTKSGLPVDQPSAKLGAAGSSARLPSGAPPSTHAAIKSISACFRLTSFAYLPTAGSAPHGGIWRDWTFSLIARAHGRASSYVSSDIGAIAAGRWHSTQFLYRIGATSLLNVGAPAPNDGAAHARTIAVNADARISSPSLP